MSGAEYTPISRNAKSYNGLVSLGPFCCGDFEARKFAVDHLGEFLEGLGSGQKPAIDKKCGCSGDPERPGFRLVGCDPLRGNTVKIGQILVEPIDVESQFARVLRVARGVQAVLVGEEFVVELPELALLMRGSCRPRGRQGVFVKAGQGQVFPDDAHLIAIYFLDSFEGRTDPRAEGSLKVGEFSNSDWSAGRSLDRRANVVDRVSAVRVGPAPRRLDLCCEGVHSAGDLTQPAIDLG